ncbi:primosomal protein DnaI [Paenisporosarcina sp. OV554]|uniref:primosomal protein DnaI n=1 Tax=Paenisporosarcina sp. OV554 TaxID=2135694 RepID=UPI000D3BCD75|nr:primosomal protein DnaI [Paenisporosarcina sp. OV554]PUB15147.1 primosomal protein DnaI [Paenisporosarcina sp. OV554]
MEPISDTLKRVVNADAFTERYEKMKSEILENRGVQAFLAENAEVVNKGMVDRGLGKLYEYTTQNHDCETCENVANCENIMKGYVPQLTIIRGLIDLDYARCRQKIVEDERREVSAMISSMHMPKDVLKARLATVTYDHNTRVNLGTAASTFMEELKTTGQLPSKGFYIYGEFGVGKSYVLGALANELAEQKIKTVLVYVPEFLREMKHAIQDQSLQEKVDYVKKAPVLMLDDLGAETLSTWTRDEILGTVLHYRMAENLPTFITSNFDYDGLEEHLAYSGKGERELVKAARIMERIRSITIPMRLSGKNRRDG